MKRENIEEKHRRKKREAATGAALFVLLQVSCTAGFGAMCLIPGLPRWAFVLLAALAVFCLLLILPALWALKRRFDEIEGGELDAAGKY